MNLILLGAPGTGKGTQAKKIMTQFNIPQISTGDILRKAIKDGTELGKKAKHILEKGELVSDDIVLGLVENRLKEKDCQKGFILDGFPRTLPQAEGLDKLLKKLAHDSVKVIQVSVPESKIIERLTSRRICSTCGRDYNLRLNPPPSDGLCPVCGGKIIQRNDDNEKTIRHRLSVYEQQTAPLVEYYSDKGYLHRVDGTRDVNQVFRDILKIIH